MTHNTIALFVYSVFVFSCNLTISGAEFRLLVIHNNDMHSRFEETNKYGGPCKRDQCYGGFARMKTAIETAKAEANKDGIPYVVLNAGDTFQGTPYYDSMRWRVVQPLIESLSIDAMTLGNHEFDLGVGNLSEYLRQVKIPVVCCNLNLTTEPRLDVPNLTPSKILSVNGTRIGVIGFLTPETMLISKTENLRILDEVGCIQAEAKRLKKSGVKIIIGLGHSGFDREVEIASQIPELSLVVGGHSHTLLYTPKDDQPDIEPAMESYPFMVTQKSGKKVPYVQAAAYTKYLGKLMLVFDDDGNVLSATGNPQLLNWTVPEDPGLKELISQWTAPQRAGLKVIKGYTRVPLILADFVNQQYESNLGNLITDVMIDYAVRRYHTDSDENWTSATVSFMNEGGIRAQIQDLGPITWEDIKMVVPFEIDIYQVQYRGSVLKKALEHSVGTIAPNSYILHYLYFSGLRVTYDLTKKVGDRVVSVEVLCSNCSVPQHKVLQENATYTVLIDNYLMDGGDEFLMFKEGKTNAVNLGVKSMATLLNLYIEREQIIYPVLDGRIKMKGSHSTTNSN